MLHHFSIAVDQPAHVASVITEITGGNFIPFPHHLGSYMAFFGDQYGTGIELYPTNVRLIPGENGVELKETGTTSSFQAFHVAISVSVSLEKIEEIGNREGWLTRVCDRGFFKVIEFWIENKIMLEFLPLEFTTQYLEFAHPDHIKKLSLQEVS